VRKGKVIVFLKINGKDFISPGFDFHRGFNMI
jgi:hypothetical protein